MKRLFTKISLSYAVYNGMSSLRETVVVTLAQNNQTMFMPGSNPNKGHMELCYSYNNYIMFFT